jgi:hypothetical protein
MAPIKLMHVVNVMGLKRTHAMCVLEVEKIDVIHAVVEEKKDVQVVEVHLKKSVGVAQEADRNPHIQMVNKYTHNVVHVREEEEIHVILVEMDT